MHGADLHTIVRGYEEVIELGLVEKGDEIIDIEPVSIDALERYKKASAVLEKGTA